MQAKGEGSIVGWISAKRPSRCTSHFDAKLGDVLTVRTPALWRWSRRSVPAAFRRCPFGRDAVAAATKSGSMAKKSAKPRSEADNGAKEQDLFE